MALLPLRAVEMGLAEPNGEMSSIVGVVSERPN